MILAPSPSAGLWLIADALSAGEARFAWRRRTLDSWAAELALPELARDASTAIRGLGVEALCARVVHGLHAAGELGRFAAIGERPGFVRALAATLDELRLAQIEPEQLARHDSDLARILAAYSGSLREAKLADRAALLAAASASARQLQSPVALLAVDISVLHAAEAAFVRALCAGPRAACVCLPAGDQPSRTAWRAALGDSVQEHPLEPPATHDLALLQRQLFCTPLSGVVASEPARVTFVSSPGEGREAVEVSRGLLALAERGVAFDRMAVVVRAVENYRAVLEEALARAEIPAHFAEGVRRPAAEGRAFNALLACANEGLSARRFAEYLSIGVAPALAAESGGAAAPAGFVSPRRWERLLVDAAVIGGRARWTRRLRGLARSMEDRLAALEDLDDPRRESLSTEIALLGQLERFAFPILDALEALPRGSSWSEWLRALDGLARLSLAAPESVCETLAELAPLGPVGSVTLDMVQRLLSPRLHSVIVRSSGNAAGRVFVGSVDDVRGRAFDSVFVLGIAEKVFPPRISEDPLLPDRVRQALQPTPRLMADRVAHERLGLRLAIGCASERAVLSFPRFDQEHNRPRVPSFYGLEVLQAIHGVLPAFDELTRRADPGAAARMGWPAPKQPDQAIDCAEYDLAILDRWLSGHEDRVGAARYLLEANQHLARALRFRWSRWKAPRFNAADGFVVTSAEARALLPRLALSARAYSATSLAQFQSCPYKFYLHAIARIAEREEAGELAELDARQRGELFHAIQRTVIEQLLTEQLLPVSEANLAAARAILQAASHAAISGAREAHAPAIARVFDDGLQQLQRDLEAWLLGMREQHAWLPTHAELSIADSTTSQRAIAIEPGLLLSGAIDLVERQLGPGSEKPVLRATDHKTGVLPERLSGITTGGKVLQPLLYALALERMFPDASVSSGRLYYCTAQGGFATHEVQLTERARNTAKQLLTAIGGMLDDGFLPAAPSGGACEYCSYRAVCGPYEEERVARVKARDAARLERLVAVRRLP